jgi:hypothetical protein
MGLVAGGDLDAFEPGAATSTRGIEGVLPFGQILEAVPASARADCGELCTGRLVSEPDCHVLKGRGMRIGETARE